MDFLNDNMDEESYYIVIVGDCSVRRSSLKNQISEKPEVEVLNIYNGSLQ